MSVIVSPFDDLTTNGRGRIEKEFGVPIPGQILPVDQWTHTALKKLPEGEWNWGTIFGRQAPVVLDIGCGNGRFSLSSALTRPTLNHFASDVLPVVIRYATRRGNQRGLPFLRFGVIGGRELLADHVPPASVSEIHCYHPQPFYDPEQVHKRLITPEFLGLVHRSLAPDGKLILQTDNPGYWRYMRAVAPHFFDFRDQREPWPEAPHGRTRREIIARREKLPVFRGWGTPLPNLSLDDVIRLAESLPPPTFDADRRLLKLDKLERE